MSDPKCPRCLSEADHSPDEKACSDHCITRHQAEIARLRQEVETLRADSEVLRHCGIVEIAVRNESGSVSDYMNHWEGRALKAEAQVETLTRQRDGLREDVKYLRTLVTP